MIYQIGLKYVENNTSKDAKSTPYGDELHELASIAKDMEMTEKRKLVVQGLRKCEKCGSALPDKAQLCAKCGTRVESSKEENKSGKSIKEISNIILEKIRLWIINYRSTWKEWQQLKREEQYIWFKRQNGRKRR